MSRAEHCRAKARELRERAARAQTAALRDELLCIARQWESLALDAEYLDAGFPAERRNGKSPLH